MAGHQSSGKQPVFTWATNKTPKPALHYMEGGTALVRCCSVVVVSLKKKSVIFTDFQLEETCSAGVRSHNRES